MGKKREKEPAAAPEEDTPREQPESAEKADEIKTLREELEKSQDALARAQAELVNMQKRHAREREAAARYRVEPLARELLDLMDTMEDAQRAMEQEENLPQALRDGQKLILRSLNQAFEKCSIEAINPLQKTFDPNQHEAMAMQPTTEVPSGQILEVFSKGYRLHDRLLRAARVVVATAPAETKTAETDESSSTDSKETS